MSQKKNGDPNGPPSYGEVYFANEYTQSAPPPPSYEESMMMRREMINVAATQHPSTAYQYYQQQQQQQQYHHQQPTGSPIMTTAANYYQTNQFPSGRSHVLQFARGAVIRTTATGAVTVPPPPPGCAPTPAQLAAMQGQQVIVKRTKNSFF